MSVIKSQLQKNTAISTTIQHKKKERSKTIFIPLFSGLHCITSSGSRINQLQKPRNLHRGLFARSMK